MQTAPQIEVLRYEHVLGKASLPRSEKRQRAAKCRLEVTGGELQKRYSPRNRFYMRRVMDCEALTEFLPSPGRGAAVDHAVRQQLGDSLETIYGRAGSSIVYDESTLSALIEDVRRGPTGPAIFGTYTDLVECIFANDVDRAQRLSDQLLALKAPCSGIQVVTLSDEDLGPDQAERYARLIDDDPGEPTCMQRTADMASASAVVTEALSLIDAGDPVLAAEIRDMAREVVVVEPAKSAVTGELSQFDGASTLYLWGAVFAGVSGKSRVDLAQTFAHETGHLLLFGLMLGQPLVENAYEERYDSPLRQDPRPMEGLVHAAYVIARMHRCLASLVDSNLLSTSEETKARSDMNDHKDCFGLALETINEEARFSDKGGKIFGNAVEYMNAQRSVALA